jgi:hypothetical protein
MGRKWIWIVPFLGGAFVGALLAMGLTYWSSRSIARGSPVLHLTFQELTQKAGDYKWNVVEDEVYSPLPPFRPDRIGRRIVANAPMPDKDQQVIGEKVANAVREALNAHGAVITGAKSLSFFNFKAPPGQAQSQTVLHMPRRYYRIGTTDGVVDAWSIVQGGEATIVICFSE